MNGKAGLVWYRWTDGLADSGIAKVACVHPKLVVSLLDLPLPIVFINTVLAKVTETHTGQ